MHFENYMQRKDKAIPMTERVQEGTCTSTLYTDSYISVTSRYTTHMCTHASTRRLLVDR